MLHRRKLDSIMAGLIGNNKLYANHATRRVKYSLGTQQCTSLSKRSVAGTTIWLPVHEAQQNNLGSNIIVQTIGTQCSLRASHTYIELAIGDKRDLTKQPLNQSCHDIIDSNS